MKERMKLEKAKKNCEKITSEKAQEPKDQQKRKNQKDGAGQKKKRKSDGETLNDGHEDQKAKERKEKKRKRKKRRNKQGKTCFRKLGKSKRLRDGLPLPQIKVPALYQCRFIEEMVLLHSCLLHVLQHHHVQLIHLGQHNTQHQLHLQHLLSTQQLLNAQHPLST